MTPEVVVFYAGLIYGQYGHQEFRDVRKTFTSEIYNGSFFHMHNPFTRESWWCRADGTPVPIEDVPKELRTMLLLMS